MLKFTLIVTFYSKGVLTQKPKYHEHSFEVGVYGPLFYKNSTTVLYNGRDVISTNIAAIKEMKVAPVFVQSSYTRTLKASFKRHLKAFC